MAKQTTMVATLDLDRWIKVTRGEHGLQQHNCGPDLCAVIDRLWDVPYEQLGRVLEMIEAEFPRVKESSIN